MSNQAAIALKSISDIFVKTFQPYQKRYTVQQNQGLFENYWFTNNQYLNSEIIRRAILGEIVAGYFVTNSPNILGIDIDDHQGTAWKGGRPSPYLLSVYSQVVQRLRSLPSLLLQSPHGLHAYWILEQNIPAVILFDEAKKLLGNTPVEIKPTPTASLRIPVEKRFIDPENFQLLNIPLYMIIQQMWIYHPAFIFDDSVFPESIRESLNTKKAKLRTLKNLPRIEKVEKELMPFVNGQTNDVKMKLCLTYRMAGLSVEEAVYRFGMCLLQSPFYTGNLRNPGQAEKFVRYEYSRNAKENYKPKPRDLQLDFFNKLAAENIAAQQPFAKQRTKPVFRLANGILEWADWHNEILKNKGQTAFFDYLYPWYRKNRKAGFYPLPQSYLRKLNFRYFDVLPWLENIGFLRQAPFKYLPKGGICKYFNIERQKFC